MSQTGTRSALAMSVKTHKWGEKEIPSGFFELPGTEHVSAVLFNNSATISKFNRLGLVAGFGSKRLVLIRQGYAYDIDPNSVEPREFRHVVNAPDYSEHWVEGLDVFHNPRAKNPVHPRMFPGAAHHRLLEDGKTESVTPSWHPLSSVTRVIVGKTDEEVQRMVDAAAARPR